MANLKKFRDLVTKYRKPYTQAELERAIGLPAAELSHRLHGNGRQPLTRQNVLDIVVILAEWQGVTWKEAVELLESMDYPLDTFEWKRRLQEHLTPPDLSSSTNWSSADVVSEIPGGMLPLPRPRLFHPPNHPEGYVPRLEIFQELKRRVLEEDSSQTIGITTALRGTGGFGKTTLARALCHDAEIQTAFPDILWIQLGEHPPQALALLNRLLTLYEESSPEALTLQEAQERWQFALHDRACLLVIDDVWQQEALSPLLQGGGRCRHLVTTRNDVLLPRSAVRVVVDAMTLPEAVQVLCQDEALPAEIAHPGYRSQLEALADRLGCWPLLLTLARGMLTDLVVESHASIAEVLTTVAKAYETRGVMAFRLDNVEERQRTVEACLSVSIQHLETFAHPHYHAAARYQELAVFPEDTDIPLATLQIYWKGSARLEPWETTDLCIRLHRLSLLLRCDLNTGTIRLHDVLRSYLIQRTGEQLPALHQRLLQAYQQHYHLARWAELPESEEYLWYRLVYHLCQANALEALQMTLTDLWYITHKVVYLGIAALEADLLLANPFFQDEVAGHASSLFGPLHRAIMRIHHLLQRVSTEAEIGGLLLSYLKEEESLTTQQLALEQELPHPFLSAWHPLPRASSAALLRTLQGHTSSVTGCAFSPDGKWIVSASADHTLKVWEAATGALLHTLRGHSKEVTGCAFSPDGKWIISTSNDHIIKVWEAATGALLHTLRGHSNRISACAFSPDGRWIVSASSDGLHKVWDAATGEEWRTFALYVSLVTSCAYSPDGKWIVSASAGRTLQVWEAATGALLHTLRGHSNRVNSCAFSPDGQWIVSASDDRTLKVWDAATGALLHTLRGHSDSVSVCAFSPDGRRIVSASNESTQVWEAATGALLHTFRGHSNRVSVCAFSPDGQWIVSTSSDKTLKVWEAATGAEQYTLSGHRDRVRGCAFSPDGQWIVSASDDHTLKVWEAATGEERHALVGHSNRVRGCAFSPDGQWIVLASDDHTLKVWEVATGEERHILRGYTYPVRGCAFSPDGQWIVSASVDKTLKVWETATGTEVRTLVGHTKPVNGCAFSPDGRWIVSASDDHMLKVWNAFTGAEQYTLRGHRNWIGACAFSPDGKWIVSASADHTLKVWEAATGALLHTLRGHSNRVNGCAFSPDGQWIVSASNDYMLKVWNAFTGAERLTLSGHTEGVRGCAVSPDGCLIVSASHDHTLKVWEVRSGQSVLTYPVDGALLGCAFHPDGAHLVAWGDLGLYLLRLVQ